ncbi:MAG: hypothetical protein ABR549_06545 [Mycobacteriales bacterium]
MSPQTRHLGQCFATDDAAEHSPAGDVDAPVDGLQAGLLAALGDADNA